MNSRRKSVSLNGRVGCDNLNRDFYYLYCLQKTYSFEFVFCVQNMTGLSPVFCKHLCRYMESGHIKLENGFH